MTDEDRDKEIEWRNETMGEVNSPEEAVEKIIEHEVEPYVRSGVDSVIEAAHGDVDQQTQMEAAGVADPGERTLGD